MDLLDIQYKLQDTVAAIATTERILAKRLNDPVPNMNLVSLRRRQVALEEQFMEESARLGLDICAYASRGAKGASMICKDCQPFFRENNSDALLDLIVEHVELCDKHADMDAVNQLLRDELRAIKNTIVATIGGVDYEGNPTSEINYLQRLRILVETEKREKQPLATYDLTEEIEAKDATILKLRTALEHVRATIWQMFDDAETDSPLEALANDELDKISD